MPQVYKYILWTLTRGCTMVFQYGAQGPAQESLALPQAGTTLGMFLCASGLPVTLCILMASVPPGARQATCSCGTS